MFARALGLMVARQLGPRGSSVTMTDNVTGAKTEHPSQAVFHGPVIYVKDTYDYVAAATSPMEHILRPLFSKTTDYQDQREYRFVLWAEKEPSECFVDLEVSLGMSEATQKQVSWSNQTTTPVVARTDPPHGSTDPQSIQQENKETVAGLKQSATPVVPDRHPLPVSAERQPAVGLDEKLKVYASIRVLRTLVDQTRNETVAASAAWHAEPYIRRLCAQFEDPINTMYFDGNHLLINVNLPQEFEHEAKVAVGPRGTAYAKIGQRKTYRLPTRAQQAGQWIPAGNIERSLRKLGLSTREALIAEGAVFREEPTADPTGMPISVATQHETADPPPSSDERPRLTSVHDIFDNPAVNQGPHQYDPNDPPEDLDEKTTVYTPIKELRNLVFETGGQAAVRAAWHAETYIRHLCAIFEDPIAEIRFDDNCLVLTVRFPQGSDSYGKIAVGPRGTAHSKIGNSRRYTDSTCEGAQIEQWSLADKIETELRNLGLPTQEANTEGGNRDQRSILPAPSQDLTSSIQQSWANDPLVTEIIIDGGPAGVMKLIGRLGGTSRTKVKVDQLTVTATPRDPTTIVEIHPTDADPTTPGHQVNTPGGHDTTITFTATARDGTRATHRFVALRS